MLNQTPTNATPNAVLRLLQAGRAADAARLGKQVLAQHPRDPALAQIVAIACLQSGDAPAGVALLRQAHALVPNDAGVAFNLAKALGDLRQFDDALAICNRPALAKVPDFMRLRADLLKAAGHTAQACDAFARVIAQNPRDIAARNNHGNALLEAGRAEEAVAAFEAARALAPQEPTLLANLALALVAARRFEQAIPVAQAAQAGAPGNAHGWQAHGRALNRLRRHEEAMPLLVEAMRLAPRDAAIIVDVALTFVALGAFDKAEQGFRHALSVDPRCAEAYLNLGSLYEQSNRTAELTGLIEQADGAGAQGDQITVLRAMQARRDGAFETARDLLASLAPDGPVDAGLRAQLLGGVADRLGDVQIAYDAFVTMNEATAANPLSVGFDRGDYRAYIATLDETLDPAWRASWPEAPPSQRPAPAFLVGFPRSGTTLLDTVLMGHGNAHVLEEQPVMAAVHEEIGHLRTIPALSPERVAQLRQMYFDKVAALGPVPDGALIVDKLPLNMLRAPLIHRLFPDARFIFAVRHPCDCVLSCFMQNFHVNRAMASFLDMDNAARTYDAALRFWEASRAALGLNVHQIHYEDVVADMAGETRKLTAFLGLDWEDGMLDFQQTAAGRGYIRTPSYAQVTEQVYTRARGRWERYRQQIAHVLPVLDPWARRYGYGPVLTDGATG